MKNSCIQHTKSSRFIKIEEDYMRLTNNNGCQSALLAYFEFRHNMKLERNVEPVIFRRKSNFIDDDGTEYEGILQWHKNSDLEVELLKIYSDKTIRNALVELEKKGYIIVTSNPESSKDQTKFFCFVCEKVQEDINNLPRLTDGKITDRHKPTGKITDEALVNLPTTDGKITDLTKNTYKEDLTKNTNIPSFVETSSTPVFQPELSTLNEKKESVKGNPQSPLSTAPLTADPKSTATSYGEILKAENAINAVEKTEISEHTQTTNQTKKTAPRANKSAKSGNVELLQKPCVDWFMEFYANRYGVPYSFKGGADAKAVSEILKYLRTLFSKSTDDYVFQKFQDVCNETTNGWVLKNGHKLTIIASEVANIAAELKQRKEAAEQARLNALNPQNNVQQPNHNTKKRRAG